MPSERLPAIAPELYDDAQRQAAEQFRANRDGAAPFGPFEAMLHSPELMAKAQAVGEYLRYRSAIGTTLSELAILLVAREWSQDYEWHVHAPIAAKVGIAAETIAAIRDGRRPAGMSEDESLVYAFSTELLRDRRVSDATWAQVETRFGKRGTVDLVGISGYYTFLAMQLNACRFALPEGGTKLPRFPEP